MLSFERSLKMDISRFTFGEAQQMFVENEKALWDHTAYLATALASVFGGKQKISPEQLNPWTSQKKSVPLNSPMGKVQAQALAKQWQQRKSNSGRSR